MWKQAFCYQSAQWMYCSYENKMQPWKINCLWLFNFYLLCWFCKVAATSAAPLPEPSVDNIKSNLYSIPISWAIRDLFKKNKKGFRGNVLTRIGELWRWRGAPKLDFLHTVGFFHTIPFKGGNLSSVWILLWIGACKEE